MRRRNLIALIAGAAAGWPLVARAQQSAVRMRRVGVVMPYAKGDAEYESRARALRQELAKLGWTEGSNVQFDERWTTEHESRAGRDSKSDGREPDGTL
jgi:putative ABC transport system substrate-binding protein